jgi:hypothetical protein
MQLAWLLRSHSDAGVRTAVLSAFASVLAALHRHSKPGAATAGSDRSAVLELPSVLLPLEDTAPITGLAAGANTSATPLPTPPIDTADDEVITVTLPPASSVASDPSGPLSELTAISARLTEDASIQRAFALTQELYSSGDNSAPSQTDKLLAISTSSAVRNSVSTEATPTEPSLRDDMLELAGLFKVP